MILAAMIKADEHALMCDFAEVYHIYDYKALQPKQAAIFAVGLSNDSRIKMKLTGKKYRTDTLLLAAVADRLSLLVWSKTKDAKKNRNRPKSILEDMIKEKDNNYASFESIEAYEAARKKVVRK